VTYESSLKDFSSLHKDIIEGLDSKKYYFKGFRNGEYQAINKVRFLGLFDTVGAADGLGGHPDSFETPYLRDLVVTPVIQSVVHLVSVNEKRKSFQVCHAERRNDGQKDKCDPVYTIWFPGVHGDIGGAVGVDKGSYKNGERAISDSTLYVMYQNITQLTVTYCFDTLVFQEWVKTLFKRDYYPMQFQQAIAHMKFNYSSNIAGFEDRVFVTLDSVPYMFNKGNWSFMFIDGLKSLRFYGLNHIYFVSQFCKNQILLQ
jgi:hypothetical protein